MSLSSNDSIFNDDGTISDALIKKWEFDYKENDLIVWSVKSLEDFGNEYNGASYAPYAS